MQLFTVLLYKISPLYLNIFLGYIAGKKLAANRDTIANIMFFLINPIIIFNGVINTQMDKGILTLPLLTFIVASSISIFFYRIARKIWTDSSKNIMAFSAGSGNTGYFGLTLAMLLFDSQTEGIYIMGLLGISLYENSIGYYISAKGIHTASESLRKLIQLPSIYAFFLALIINFLALPVPEVFKDFMGHIKGVYSVLGMMIIGIGLAGLESFKLDVKFIGMTFLAKFLVWPLTIFTIVTLDANYIEYFSSSVHEALILLSIVPLAVNTVVMASLMKSQPEKVAATVMLSTIFALLYVPFMTSLLLARS